MVVVPLRNNLSWRSINIITKTTSWWSSKDETDRPTNQKRETKRRLVRLTHSSSISIIACHHYLSYHSSYYNYYINGHLSGRGIILSYLKGTRWDGIRRYNSIQQSVINMQPPQRAYFIRFHYSATSILWGDGTKRDDEQSVDSTNAAHGSADMVACSTTA